MVRGIAAQGIRDSYMYREPARVPDGENILARSRAKKV